VAEAEIEVEEEDLVEEVVVAVVSEIWDLLTKLFHVELLCMLLKNLL
jgi:hypothetical protein